MQVHDLGCTIALTFLPLILFTSWAIIFKGCQITTVTNVVLKLCRQMNSTSMLSIMLTNYCSSTYQYIFTLQHIALSFFYPVQFLTLLFNGLQCIFVLVQWAWYWTLANIMEIRRSLINNLLYWFCVCNMFTFRFRYFCLGSEIPAREYMIKGNRVFYF